MRVYLINDICIIVVRLMVKHRRHSTINKEYQGIYYSFFGGFGVGNRRTSMAINWRKKYDVDKIYSIKTGRETKYFVPKNY